MLFVLVVDTEVVPEPITVSDHIKAFLEDPQWFEHIKDPQLKQMKRQSSSILIENGICIVDGDGCEWFLCLLGQCSEKSKHVWIKCSKNASLNATKHLKTQHCIVSSKTISQQQTIHQLSKHMISLEILSRLTRLGGSRCRSLHGQPSNRCRTALLRHNGGD